jgi:indolepyruvate ferredoxin oxidoreductase beta subunit
VIAFDCVIAGVGGQGAVLAARLLGAAALGRGLPVRGSETIGMAQRGGSVVSHIRVGSSFSPMIPHNRADTIIALEPAEGLRAIRFLKPGGTALVLNRPVAPVTGNYDSEAVLEALRLHVDRLFVIDGGAAVKAVGAKCLNVMMLGAAIYAGAAPFAIADIERVLAERVKVKFLDANIRALTYCEGLSKSNALEK